MWTRSSSKINLKKMTSLDIKSNILSQFVIPVTKYYEDPDGQLGYLLITE